ncbi:MAG TPA: hypothetical protein VGT08_08840 [Terracidiphilus sp.]|nr:hypothetical protein [Terracidiphilus sp.]
MTDQRSYLRHDLTALYSFIESIVEGVTSQRSSAAYSPAAVRFLGYVSSLAESSKKHLSSWSVADDEEFEDRREELGTIRAAWRELHKLIKPSLDADTLQVPLAVVDGIVRRFREIPGYNETEFVLFHTAEFNYVQIRTADLRSLSSKIRALIPNSPAFPPNLGLIGMPYSQGRTAFANCLVAHEMGHFVYRDKSLDGSLQVEADRALKLSFSNYEGQNQEEKERWIRYVTRWAEELFCDLFGVMLLGPCYTYAYIEAYDLSAVLNSAGQISDERISARMEFYENHPSHIFRLQQQSEFLRESHWWDHIGRTQARFSTLLQAIVGLKSETHVKQNSSFGRLISPLIATIPSIRKAASKVFDDIDDWFDSFSLLNPCVQEYLAAGVVPSTLNIRISGRPKIATVSASPLVLLNSGMEFYLIRIDELMRSIPGEDESHFDRRLHWIRRIEEWIAKAIEDESLEPVINFARVAGPDLRA